MGRKGNRRLNSVRQRETEKIQRLSAKNIVRPEPEVVVEDNKFKQGPRFLQEGEHEVFNTTSSIRLVNLAADPRREVPDELYLRVAKEKGWSVACDALIEGLSRVPRYGKERV